MSASSSASSVVPNDVYPQLTDAEFETRVTEIELMFSIIAAKQRGFKLTDAALYQQKVQQNLLFLALCTHK
jgi:hypothetical protein